MKPLNPNRRIQEKQGPKAKDASKQMANNATDVMKKPAAQAKEIAVAMEAGPLNKSDRAQELLKKAEGISTTALPESRYGQKEKEQ